MGLFGPPDIKKLKTKKNVKGLVNALKHKDSKIRCEAAYALADAVEDAEDTGTREALTGAMEDQADEVRKAANSSLRDLEWYEPDPADVGEAKRLVAELQCGDQARISTAVAGILEHVRVTVRGYGDFNPQDDIGYELEKILCPPAPTKPGVHYLGAPRIETDEFIAFMLLGDTKNPNRHEYRDELKRREPEWKSTIIDMEREE